MAAINSHRKRQVYHPHIGRRSYYGQIGHSPAGAATMMPDKAVSGDAWYAGKREFANISKMLSYTFLGSTLEARTLRDPNTGVYVTRDRLQTLPSAFMNPYAEHNPMRYHYGNTSSGSPMIYTVDMAGVNGYLQYSRRNNGLLMNGHNNYKSITTPTGRKYQHVIDLGSSIGGNIKSRGILARWILGMWRAK